MSTVFRDRVVLSKEGEVDPLMIVDSDYTVVPATGRIMVDLLDGWRDSDEVDPILVDQPDDGAYAGEGWKSKERYITVGGWIDDPASSSAANVDAARNKLIQVVSQPEFIVTRYGSVPKSLRCRRIGKVEFFDDINVGTRWAFQAVAPNPFKYSPTSSNQVTYAFSGGDYYRLYPRTYALVTFTRTYTPVAGTSVTTNPIVFNNIGTATYKPRDVTIYGPLPSGSWELINETTGEHMWAYVDLPTVDDSLIIDMERQKATLNGYDVTHLMYGDWFGLKPGVNTIRLYADATESADAYVRFPNNRSAWR